MKMIIGLAVVLSLAACQIHREPSRPHVSSLPTAVITVDGPETAADLTARYADTRQDCGKPSTPAFLCSGVILRITTYSPDYDSWDPSDNSVRLGAQSFSYVRKDSKFSRLAWSLSNGYILYPIFSAPPDKMDPDVLCIFPIDGYTNDRTGERCGPYADNNATSRPCGIQSITTAQQWINLYNA
ncbi:hypothetical protein [Pseudomonas sp. PSKL.D1]|uniref:hypothetical protein n=1 Tax=Pseudomonas sp. PSKL.D1 TaxID=3029060 RepID=UPI002381352F|nr:hypothetical protein [Pseudomonas sp. PSKL.D1]WDY59151.1 hypothetical protein PVV54_05820 [Pseudomonas sp. PSKL.D1]